MTIIVKIFSRLIEPECGCINWMDHWEKATGGRRVTCSHVHCYNENIRAVIVQDKEEKLLIVPLCIDCASNDSEIEIAEAYVAAVKLPSCKFSSFN